MPGPEAPAPRRLCFSGVIGGAVALTVAVAVSVAPRRTAFLATGCAVVNTVCETAVMAPGALRLTKRRFDTA
jgi:hypothetical protein